MQIPTRYDSREELIMDMNILGKILQVPSKTIDELTKSLKSEYRLKHPLPSLEQKRYEISETVSNDYFITGEEELVLGDNETLIDLSADDDTLVLDTSGILVPEESKEFFKYENHVTPSIMEEFLKGNAEKYSGGIEKVEPTTADEQYVLDDSTIEMMSATTETWGSGGLDIDIDIEDSSDVATSEPVGEEYVVDTGEVVHIEPEYLEEEHETEQVSLDFADTEPGGSITDGDFQWNSGFGVEDYIEVTQQEVSDFDSDDLENEEDSFDSDFGVADIDNSDLYDSVLDASASDFDEDDSDSDSGFDEDASEFYEEGLDSEELEEDSDEDDYYEEDSDSDELEEDDYYEEDDSDELEEDSDELEEDSDELEEDDYYEEDDSDELEEDSDELEEDDYYEEEDEEDSDVEEALEEDDYYEEEEDDSDVEEELEEDFDTEEDSEELEEDSEEEEYYEEDSGELEEDSEDDDSDMFDEDGSGFTQDKPISRNKESPSEGNLQPGRLSTEDDFVASILTNTALSSDQKAKLLETYYMTNKTTTKSDFGEMPVKEEPQKVVKPVVEEETYKDVRDFVRKHPRCRVSQVLEHFSRKALEDEIRKGRLIRKGDIIHRV